MSRSGGAAGDHGVAAALFAALAPGSPVGIAVHDEALRMTLVTPSLAALTGLPAEALLGRTLAEALPEAGVPVDAALRRVAETGRPLAEVEGPAPIGGDVTWLVSVHPLDHGGRRLLAGVAVDVSERRAAEDRLRDSRRMLAEAERLAGVGSWSWDVSRNKWAWSEELLRVAGLPTGAEPPPWQEWIETVEPESRAAVRETTRRAVRDGKPFEIAFDVRRPDGARRHLRGRGEPVAGADGRVQRIDGFVQDVSELRRAEAQQRAVAELGQLALSGLPGSELMHHAVDTVVNTLQLDHGSMLELQPDGGLLLRAGHGWPEGEVGVRSLPGGTGSAVGYTLLTGMPVVVEDWREEQRFARPALLEEQGILSTAAVPIGSPEAPYGALSAHARVPGRVGREDVAFLEAVANLLASAIDRLQAEAEVAGQAAARGRLVALALEAEDRTRRTISEALHDGPLQDLLALGHDVARLRAGDERDAHHLERVREGIRRAVQQVREAMLDLHPVVLEVGGLEPALSAIAAQQARLGAYECELQVDPDTPGPRDGLVLALARELLVNATKHARATRVDVSLHRIGDTLLLEVVDDGVGIPEGRLQAALLDGHIGLASNRERAEAAGGRLLVAPRADGGGVRAVAVLPVE